MFKSNRISPNKLYILARRDLSCAERAVQSCHALAELLRKGGEDP